MNKNLLNAEYRRQKNNKTVNVANKNLEIYYTKQLYIIEILLIKYIYNVFNLIEVFFVYLNNFREKKNFLSRRVNLTFAPI